MTKITAEDFGLLENENDWFFDLDILADMFPIREQIGRWNINIAQPTILMSQETWNEIVNTRNNNI